jgi:hypothetical protein
MMKRVSIILLTITTLHAADGVRQGPEVFVTEPDGGAVTQMTFDKPQKGPHPTQKDLDALQDYGLYHKMIQVLGGTEQELKKIMKEHNITREELERIYDAPKENEYHVAAYSGDFSLLEFLLKRKSGQSVQATVAHNARLKKQLTAKTDTGYTPYGIAIGEGYESIAVALKEQTQTLSHKALLKSKNVLVGLYFFLLCVYLL